MFWLNLNDYDFSNTDYNRSFTRIWAPVSVAAALRPFSPNFSSLFIYKGLGVLTGTLLQEKFVQWLPYVYETASSLTCKTQLIALTIIVELIITTISPLTGCILAFGTGIAAGLFLEPMTFKPRNDTKNTIHANIWGELPK